MVREFVESVRYSVIFCSLVNAQLASIVQYDQVSKSGANTQPEGQDQGKNWTFKAGQKDALKVCRLLTDTGERRTMIGQAELTSKYATQQ